MKKPTELQIEKEIVALKYCETRVRPTTAFGESNTEAIRVQIRVLEDRMSDDEINDTWGDDERLLGMAIEAMNWLRGEAGLQSEEWKPLLQK